MSRIAGGWEGRDTDHYVGRESRAASRGPAKHRKARNASVRHGGKCRSQPVSRVHPPLYPSCGGSIVNPGLGEPSRRSSCKEVAKKEHLAAMRSSSQSMIPKSGNRFSEKIMLHKIPDQGRTGDLSCKRDVRLGPRVTAVTVSRVCTAAWSRICSGRSSPPRVTRKQ